MTLERFIELLKQQIEILKLNPDIKVVCESGTPSGEFWYNASMNRLTILSR